MEKNTCFCDLRSANNVLSTEMKSIQDYSWKCKRDQLLHAAKLEFWRSDMTMSWHGNAFCITSPLSGEFTNHWWIPPTKGQWYELLVFSLLPAGTSCRMKQYSWQWFETPWCRFNTLKLKQSVRHFSANIFTDIFLNENVWNLNFA